MPRDPQPREQATHRRLNTLRGTKDDRSVRYRALGHQDRYAVAQLLGDVTRAPAAESVMLLGPGRWGSTTPALGVPVSFLNVSAAAVRVEYTYPEGDCAGAVVRQPTSSRA